MDPAGETTEVVTAKGFKPYRLSPGGGRSRGTDWGVPVRTLTPGTPAAFAPNAPPPGTFHCVVFYAMFPFFTHRCLTFVSLFFPVSRTCGSRGDPPVWDSNSRTCGSRGAPPYGDSFLSAQNMASQFFLRFGRHRAHSLLNKTNANFQIRPFRQPSYH